MDRIKQPIPVKVADGAAAAVYNNKMYIFGGYDNTANDILNICYEYNPASNTWTQKSDMPTATWGEIAVQYGGKVYVFLEVGVMLHLLQEIQEIHLTFHSTGPMGFCTQMLCIFQTVKTGTNIG